MKSEQTLLQLRKPMGQAPYQTDEDEPPQKLSATELRQLEERCRAILEEIEEGYFETDLAGNLVFINERMCKLTGFSKAGLLGMNTKDLTGPESVEKMRGFFNDIYQTGRSAKLMEFQIIGERGSKSSFEISSCLIRDAEGRPKGFRGFVRGVARRTDADEAVNLSEKSYRRLFEESLDAIVITDRKGRFIDANNAALDLFRFSREEASKITFKHLYADPKDGLRFKQEIEAKGCLRDFEVSLKKKDGMTMMCVLFVTAKRDHEGEITGYHGIIRDITKARATEMALRQSEEKYRQLLNHAPAGIYEIDFLKRAFLNVNDVMCEYTGYTKEELLSLSPFDILTEESKAHFIERMTKVFSEGKAPETAEYKFKGKSGREFWVLLNTKLVYENGFPKGATAVVHDITERKLAEEALRRSEEKYRLLVDNANDGVFIAQNGRMKFPNPKMMQILEYSADELAEMHYLDLVYPEDRVIIDRVKERSPKEGESASIYSIRVRNKAGRQIWAQISSVPIYWNERPATLNFVRDITCQRVAEDELRQTVEKLRKVTGATVQAMSQTVEVRDPYTAGHQKRVSNIAGAIATEMSLSPAMVEGIRMAGNIHDIGKISVPAEILSKPGSLTDIQFGLVKTHPKTGYEILKGIEFPWDIARIVLQHHERIDGSGYPQGLLGEDILLEAKVLGVADVVEAMTSHRPYRPALGVAKALDELSSKKGILYDARVVEAFEKAIKAGNLELEKD